MSSISRTSLLLFSLGYPTVLTLVYFQWLQTSPPAVQQSVYAIGKLIQFGFPMLYLVLLFPPSPRMEAEPMVGNLRGNLKQPGSARQSLILGIFFGLAVVIAMFVVYHWLLPLDLKERMSAMVQQKITLMGIGTVGKFFAVSLFYVIGHSLLEEYYWRWFVFSQLQKSLRSWQANLISALGFMAHHIVLLGFFFGWNSPMTYLLSGSVAIGGLFWAWLFNREWGFRSAWLSHAMVDAGIFGLGMLIHFR